MTKVNQGLRQLAKRDLLPDGDYQVRLTHIFDTRKGDGDMARLLVLKGPEAELKGKSCVMYIYNKETGQGIGLSQILKAIQYEGELEDTTELIGAEFECKITEGINEKTGEAVNNVTPYFDVEWWNDFLLRGDDKPRSKKKASKRR